MPAQSLDLVIEKGSKKAITVYYKDSSGVAIDLSSYEARMQAREKIDDATTIFDLSSTGGTPEITIEPGGETGRIDILIGATTTTAITQDTGVYDLEIYDPLDTDDVSRLLQGYIEFRDEVTR